MKYKVVLERPARKFIQKQPPEQQKRILTALSKLPEQGDIFPMRGRKNQYRVRIGTYRAIYRLEQNVLTVTVSLFSILVVYHSVLIPVVIDVLDIVIVLQRVNELLHVLQECAASRVIYL